MAAELLAFAFALLWISLRPRFADQLSLSLPLQNTLPLTLTDRTLTLELGADATVAAVKAAVEAKHGEFSRRGRKAIDKGVKKRAPAFLRTLSLSPSL